MELFLILAAALAIPAFVIWRNRNTRNTTNEGTGDGDIDEFMTAGRVRTDRGGGNEDLGGDVGD
ncbi:MAG: hypothetical protein AAFR35_03425 [Pseudomonadota bacterium]